MMRDINSYTMEELWGSSNPIKNINFRTSSRHKKNKVYCIKLRHGGYVVINDSDGYIEVPTVDSAEHFMSADEAEEFIRVNWIDGKIEEYKIKDGELIYA